MEFFIDPVVFLAGKTGIEQKYIRHLIHLTEEGATIPFIARYRKEIKKFHCIKSLISQRLYVPPLKTNKKTKSGTKIQVLEFIAYLYGQKLNIPERNPDHLHLIHLTEEGATIPFIARYRKEMTGNMDEVKIAEIREMYVRFQELEKKKGSVMETIRQQGKLTDRLEQQIRECQDLQTLEDIYLPFKPKRQPRRIASIR